MTRARIWHQVSYLCQQCQAGQVVNGCASVRRRRIGRGPIPYLCSYSLMCSAARSIQEAWRDLATQICIQAAENAQYSRDHRRDPSDKPAQWTVSETIIVLATKPPPRKADRDSFSVLRPLRRHRKCKATSESSNGSNLPMNSSCRWQMVRKSSKDKMYREKTKICR